MKKESNFNFKSYWPEDKEADLILDTPEVLLGRTDATDIEDGASLLVWAADSLDTLLEKLSMHLNKFPSPLYSKIPGQEDEVKSIIVKLKELGFNLMDMHLDMRLYPIPELEYPKEVLSGPDQDFAALAGVDALVFDLYQQDEKELRNKANSQDWTVLSINADRKPAGLIVGNIYGPKMDHLFIRSMAVLPEFRGRGLGRKLLTALLAWGRQQGADRSMLWLSDVHNKPARRLYESLGYTGREVEAELVKK